VNTVVINRILHRLEAGVDDDQHQEVMDKTGFWGKAAAGGLFLARDTGRFLVGKRSKEVNEPGTWGTFGGAIDEGEDPKSAAKREMVEETRYVGEADIFPLYVFRHASGFRYHNYLMVVDKEFTPKLDWENSGYRWCAFGKWPQPLHYGLKKLLEEDGAKLKGFVK
jgi:8-oxo-dGTP pyrophosphatase MutT (NUDIX family)